MQITHIIRIFNQSIADYHLTDDIHTPISNPYPDGSLQHLLYAKNWIDTVQWHLEDLIRHPEIDKTEALHLKRSIDKHNQIRTDMVEHLDDHFLGQYQHIPLQPTYRLNTETLGWAIDRLSILCLKIYHMDIEAKRTDSDATQRNFCERRLETLLQQQADLSLAIEQLRAELEQGKVRYLTYKQMKMYNDPATNPVLYSLKK